MDLVLVSGKTIIKGNITLYDNETAKIIITEHEPDSLFTGEYNLKLIEKELPR